MNCIPVKSDYSGDWEELMETMTIFVNIVMNSYHFAVVILLCFSCSTVGDWEELMETITIFLNIVMNFYHFVVVILFCFSCSTIVVLPNLWWIIVQPQGNSLRFMMRCWCSLSGSIIHVYAGWVHCILWKEKEPQGG